MDDLHPVHPVPEDERCREPRRHRTPDNTRCPLCADQMALPGFEEIA